MNSPSNDFSRRAFLAAGGAGLAVAAMAHSPVAHADTKAVEKANEELVMNLCKEIESLDADKLAPYFADNIVFQLIDGQPLIEGKEAFLAAGAAFFTPFQKAEFIVHRSHVIGNLVINERTDNFTAKEGGQDQSFHVSGVFLVKNGKIEVWKDYMLPE